MARIVLIIVMLLNFSFVSAQLSEQAMVSYTRYLLYVPAQAKAGEKLPLILFLHGSGERGSDLSKLKNIGPFTFIKDSTNFPFIVVAPQANEGRDWDTQNLLTLLDSIEKKLPVDASRIYVTGLSMGGFGAWKLAQAAPLRFAAIAPVCGGGDSSYVCAIRNMAVWAFHGAKDDVVPYQESERMVNGLKKLKADVKFTLYPDAGHDAWTATYQNPALYDWLLSKRSNTTFKVKESALKKLAGTYRYSDKENMIVSVSADTLYVQSTAGNNRLPLVAFAPGKFRIPGGFSGDGEVYFDVSEGDVVRGLSIGPCDHTYCRKIK